MASCAPPNSVSPSLTARDVFISLAAYIVVYLVVFPAGAIVDDPHRAEGPGGSRRSRRGDRKRTAGGPDHRRNRRGGAQAMTAALSFVPIWTLILGFGVFFYVVLDGFDLGVGILYGFSPIGSPATSTMNAIAPIWDGNETWLVLGGVGAVRGVSARLRDHHPGGLFSDYRDVAGPGVSRRRVRVSLSRRRASHASGTRGFFVGSTVATFAQGRRARRLHPGLPRRRTRLRRGSLDCFTPFSCLTGIALVFGYALLGAGWLIIKTEGDRAGAARGGRAAFALLGVVVAIARRQRLDAPADPEIAQRWFSWPNMLLLSPVPLATALVALAAWRALREAPDAAPFLAAIGLFLMSYLGIAISLWPMIVPHTTRCGRRRPRRAPRRSYWSARCSCCR